MSRRPNADAEIALLQRRIRLHRLALTLSLDATKQAFRERLSSPFALIGAVGAGFVIGNMTKHSEPGQPSGAASGLRGLWNVLKQSAQTALRFAQSGPVMWIASHLSARADDAEPPPEPDEEAFASPQ
jgi:hypothetical protein